MIIAKTIKGKGVSFLENQDGWHGKPVPKEKLEEALKELGEVDLNIRGEIAHPVILNDSEGSSDSASLDSSSSTQNDKLANYKVGDLISTREAYGDALVSLGQTAPNLVVLDAEVSNSTFSEKFKKAFPDRFFEMFIAEQNMVSVALGLSKVGWGVFASTFAAFFSRAFDQIRMAEFSQGNIKLIGSHSGVYIGQDGPSQMGLTDIAMFRSILNSTVLCPADATAAFKLTAEMVNAKGIVYLRTGREKTPVIYDQNETFEIGGSKILRKSNNDTAVVFAVGITVHEALKAHEELKKENINVAVVDLYSIKPIDHVTIQQFSHLPMIVAEDHYPAGGLGEAVANVILASEARPGSVDSGQARMTFMHLCVRKIPRSGSPGELLNFEEINAEAIIKAVKSLFSSS